MKQFVKEAIKALGVFLVCGFLGFLLSRTYISFRDSKTITHYPHSDIAMCTDFTVAMCDHAEIVCEGEFKTCAEDGIKLCIKNFDFSDREPIKPDVLYGSCLPSIGNLTCQDIQMDWPESCYDALNIAYNN